MVQTDGTAMRELWMAGMLVLVAAAAAPSAVADSHQCTISLADPTNPEWSDSCTAPPSIERTPHHAPTITVIVDTETTVGTVDDATGVCDAPASCEDLFAANLTGDSELAEDADGADEALNVSTELVAAGHEAEAEASPSGCSGQALWLSVECGHPEP